MRRTSRSGIDEKYVAPGEGRAASARRWSATHLPKECFRAELDSDPVEPVEYWQKEKSSELERTDEKEQTGRPEDSEATFGP